MKLRPIISVNNERVTQRFMAGKTLVAMSPLVTAFRLLTWVHRSALSHGSFLPSPPHDSYGEHDLFHSSKSFLVPKAQEAFAVRG